jgi:hypothetical protein
MHPGLRCVSLRAQSYIDASGNTHGFVWQNGTATSVDYPLGVGTTYLLQDNSSGQVAGYYSGMDGVSHSVIYNSASGTWSTVPDAPGGYAFNAAGGINDQGQLAGEYSPNAAGPPNLVGWLYNIKANSYTSFTVPPSGSDQSYYGSDTAGMNNHGDISGFYVDSSGIYHGFVWDPATGSRTIDVPGATGGTFAQGINDAGTVVGGYFVGNTQYGFILTSTNNLTSFAYAGANNTVISAIDDRGDIAGFYQDTIGNWHSFYGLAVPEPSSIVLALAGVVIIGGYARLSNRSSRSGTEQQKRD